MNLLHRCALDDWGGGGTKSHPSPTSNDVIDVKAIVQTLFEVIVEPVSL